MRRWQDSVLSSTGDVLPAVPDGVPERPTLVIAFEDLIVHTEWDVRPLRVQLHDFVGQRILFFLQLNVLCVFVCVVLADSERMGFGRRNVLVST